MGRSKLSRRAVLRGAFLLAGLATINSVADTEWVEVTRHKIELPNWRVAPMRIAVISDVHLNEPIDVDRAIRAVELVSREFPDVILLPGDFVSNTAPPSIINLRRFLKGVGKVNIPSFASMGNHDAHCGQPIWIVKEFQNSSTTLLINDFVQFKDIVITGLDDAIYGHPQPDEVFGGAYRPYPHDRPTICMAHEPDYAAELDYSIDLVLSGHTHGGQVCMPFGLPFHLPRGGKNFISGWYPDEKTPMYVSRGVGTVGVPFRMFCRPEAAILDISGYAT